MDKTIILEQLNSFIEAKQANENDKKTARFLSALRSVTEEELSFGEQPKYFFAYMECNSTGVGRSSFQGTETQRTIARDYTTDEYLFVDGHVGAAEKGLQLFFIKPGQTIKYYKKSDIITLSKEHGFQLHLQYFRDLNFTLYDHRLNRHTVNITKGPFTYPVRPIYAATKAGEKFTLGYLYEVSGQEHILIEPDDPKKIEKEKSNTGCSPWMLLGFVFPPIFLVAGFVWLVQVQKERMRG